MQKKSAIITETMLASAVALAGVVALDVAQASSQPPGRICKEQRVDSMCWVEVEGRQGCYLKIDVRLEEETYRWSGDCPDGLASGQGILEVTHLDYEDQERTGTGDGAFSDGMMQDHWAWRWSDGYSGEGAYVDGIPEGPWVTHRPDGSVGEQGSYVNGQKHGQWMERRYAWEGIAEGRYVDGFAEGDWTIRMHDGSTQIETYSDGVLVETREGPSDMAATDDVSGDAAEPSPAGQQASEGPVAMADASSAEAGTQSSEKTLDLPSPNECVRFEEKSARALGDTVYQGDYPLNLIVTNSCPETVVVYRSADIEYSMLTSYSIDPVPVPDAVVLDPWYRKDHEFYTVYNQGRFERRNVVEPGSWKTLLSIFDPWENDGVMWPWRACAEYYPLEAHQAAGYRTCEESDLPKFYWKCIDMPFEERHSLTMAENVLTRGACK